GPVVGLAVLVRDVDRDGAAVRGELLHEYVGEALAVVVVDVGQRYVGDALGRKQISELHALERVRRRGAEHQVVVLERGQHRSGGRRRDHDDATGDARRGRGADRSAGAEGADIGGDLVGV